MHNISSTLGRLVVSATVGVLMFVSSSCNSKEPSPAGEPTPTQVPGPTPTSVPKAGTLHTVTIGPKPCDINPATVTLHDPTASPDQVVWKASAATSNVTLVLFPSSGYPTGAPDPLANMSSVSNGSQVTNPESKQDINPKLSPPTDGYTYSYTPYLDKVPCSDNGVYGHIIIVRP
jgi:hypothetical protein